MAAVVFVEHHDGEPAKACLGVLAKARSLWGDVAALVCGQGVEGIAGELGAHGATTVYVADDPVLAEPLPQPRVDVIAELVEAKGIETVLFGASVLAADVASALSARLDGGLNWGLTDLRIEEGRLIGTQPALQDSVYVDCGWTATPQIGLVRAGAFEPAEFGGEPAVESVPVSVSEWSLAARMVERAHAESEGPSIEETEIIVAGGRGLGGPEGFEPVEALAGALGGAVAATRAVVDAGWYPYSAQVGQTGKTVAPKLYVACGISGAIQHKVGMQGSGAIVAINKDRNAPIFDYCDFGVVGDLNQIVPRLTELVRQRRST